MNKDFFINVNGEVIEVSEEIYIAYYKMGRRERYLEEVSRSRNLSYEGLMDSGASIEAELADKQKLVEDIITDKIMLERLSVVLDALDEDEMLIINELFLKGRSENEYAKSTGIPRKTLSYRKGKVLEKLRKLMNELHFFKNK